MNQNNKNKQPNQAHNQPRQPGGKPAPDKVKVIVRPAANDPIKVSVEKDRHDVSVVLTPVSEPARDILVLVTVQNIDCGLHRVSNTKALTFEKLALDLKQEIEVVATNAANDQLTNKVVISTKNIATPTPKQKIELMTVEVGNLGPNCFQSVVVQTQNADGTKEVRKIKIMVGQKAEALDGTKAVNGVFEFTTDASGTLTTFIKLEEADTTAVISDDRGVVTKRTSLLKEP